MKGEHEIGDFELAVIIRDQAEKEIRAALAAIPKAFEEAICAQSIIFAQASERAFRKHVVERHTVGKGEPK